MSNRKDLEQLITKLRKSGWTCEKTRSNHWKMVPPGGGRPVICGGTPSEYRGFRNLLAVLRRSGYEE